MFKVTHIYIYVGWCDVIRTTHKITQVPLGCEQNGPHHCRYPRIHSGLEPYFCSFGLGSCILSGHLGWGLGMAMSETPGCKLGRKAWPSRRPWFLAWYFGTCCLPVIPDDPWALALIRPGHFHDFLCAFCAQTGTENQNHYVKFQLMT